MMTERLLQFIWQFQYFNNKELVTVTGEKAEIIFPGYYNTNQGPDFKNARIRIGNATWAGSIELHIQASGWKKHKHQQDANYQNVILHVVWENDEEQAAAGQSLPLVELKSRVSQLLLCRYTELMDTASFIPCEKILHQVSDLVWHSWKERLLIERLLRKSKTAEEYLRENNYHWEETFWWLLSRSFGAKVNADAFEAMARTIPFKVLARQRNQLHQTEALLLGQIGLLSKQFAEDYPKLLKREYHFLRKKYSLRPALLPVHFLRMRPGNFPTIRLAQLAMLIHQAVHLFAAIKETVSLEEIRSKFDLEAGEYWHFHYRFDEPTGFKKKKLGRFMIDTIIINTVIPLVFAYGDYYDDQKYKDRVFGWLGEIPAEMNAVTLGFQQMGIDNDSAYDSQALIELKNEYCVKKRCLECAVGNALLRQKSHT